MSAPTEGQAKQDMRRSDFENRDGASSATAGHAQGPSLRINPARRPRRMQSHPSLESRRREPYLPECTTPQASIPQFLFPEFFGMTPKLLTLTLSCSMGPVRPGLEPVGTLVLDFQSPIGYRSYRLDDVSLFDNTKFLC